MWDALKIRNNLTKTIAKKIALVLFVLAITLVTVGCAPKPVESIDTPTTANTSVSPEPKPAPVPPVETKSPWELELEEFLEKAPEISGLTKSISENKIVYNNEQGEYSGYYVEKAYYNGDKVGGVSLTASIVESIIEENISQGKEEYIPLPVDPSEGQTVSVRFEQTKFINGLNRDYGYIYLSVDSETNLTNFYIGEREIFKLRYTFDNEKTIKICFETKNAVFNNCVEGDYLSNFGIYIDNGTIKGESPVQEFFPKMVMFLDK